MTVRAKAEAARSAARTLLSSPDEARRAVLRHLADALEAGPEAVLAANHADVLQAETEALPRPLLERLHLDADKLATLADGCRQLADRDDPVGHTLRSTVLDDGLHLWQVTCPLGVVACIFESRPDAVVQIAALALRTGNAVILKGGREAHRSTEALAALVQDALEAAGLPRDAVQTLADRDEATALLELDGLVDLVVPRGSSGLVRFVKEHTRIPVLGHAEGVCHLYVDKAADLRKARAVILDAKLDYPAACNAVETVLVHVALTAEVPALVADLEQAGIEVRQHDADFTAEYGAPILNLAIVPDLGAALRHIARYGSGHTDGILTEDPEAARRFVAAVDSAGVYVNASTRFADGYRYGLGAEVGISTSKVHARGPVGLEGLLSSRWILVGDGHTAGAYRHKAFRHEPSATPFSEQEEAWHA